MAKLAGKKKISKDEMSQEINLKRYLGRNPTDNEKRLFGELAIEKINERTLDGKTIHGGKFKKYSKEYADLKGVTRDSVDLFLEGDMLDSLETSESGNRVKIEIGGADVESKKGYNHHVGDTTKKRPWFGLTTEEARQIANEVKEEKPRESRFTLAEIRAALEALDIEVS